MAQRYKLDLDHLGDLPEPLDREDLEERVDEFRKTGQHREAIIMSHLRLSISHAAFYTARCPRKEEDFICEAFLSLIEAVDRFRRLGRDNNITPYISKTVWFALLRELVEGRPVKLPDKRTWQEQVEALDVEESSFLRDPDKIIAKDRIRFDLRDILHHCAKSEEDWKIILAAYQGYTLAETAEMIGRSTSYVGTRRDALFQRFIYYWTKDD